MSTVEFAALAPLLALLGALINGLFGRSLKEPWPGYIASAMVGLGFLFSLFAFFALSGGQEASVHIVLWDYLKAGSFDLSLGLMLDTLSITMMLIITGVGFLIHIYSIAYMHGDKGFSRYFAFLNLFVAAMLILVMADSFFLMFIGWEGVGVCSYLLISFWYTEKPNADAARKAFITNRVGDVGFLLAMFLTVFAFGTLNIHEVNELALAGAASAGLITVIGLFYLLAATGKSAQLPLQVWLPDAMAGPTPVSALIHAATMVTAGVYLIARAAPLFALSPVASTWVAWIGALTALIAAFSAFAQTDIKKILAYSTISQLGYMFVAVGVGAYWVGIFHVFTHAFFKALLFLGSGSVIHALGGEQDIRKMGGLHKHMKVTSITSLIATFAIAGVPFLAGFFSKDAILAHVFNSKLIGGSKYLLYIILLLTAVMTAFYMFRWYYQIFRGEERLSKEAKAHVHESPALMTLPLMVLAFFSVIAGYFGLPEFAFPNVFAHWIERSVEAPVGFAHPAVAIEWLLILVSIAAAALGLALGYWVYAIRKGQPAQRDRGALGHLSANGSGFDDLYRPLFIRSSEGIASGLSSLDSSVVNKGISQSASLVGVLANVVRWLQTGYARQYALFMFIGVAILALVVALSGGLA